MAHVNNIPLIGINSLEILGANIDFCKKKICSILDAQRNQVYTCKYIFEEEKNKALEEISIMPIDDLLGELSATNEEWVIVGEAVYKYKEKIEAISNITISSPPNNITKASSLCTVAKYKFEQNTDVHNCYDINPMYIRKSQAEEQYEEKQKRLRDGK
ncbi:hypothetical protein SDC9_117812 [bioreactor metagenome]|uniref:Gcp-like domain-containing protein n=2 Tax=root TaxID=1 RepID=A0A645C1P5_9ZZZZ